MKILLLPRSNIPCTYRRDDFGSLSNIQKHLQQNAWAALAGDSSDSDSEEGKEEQSDDNTLLRTAEEPSKEENNNPKIQPPTKELANEEKTLVEINPHTKDATLNTTTSEPDTAAQPRLKSNNNTTDTNCVSTRTKATKKPDTKQSPKTVTRVSIPSRPTQTVPQKIRKGLINTNSLDEAMRVLKSLRPVPKVFESE